jgi:hypothetical protein
MPEIWTGFLAEFDRLKIKLPLKLSPYDIGDVIDSNGRHLCICDVNCERSDQEAVAIAACIVRAINSCAATIQRQPRVKKAVHQFIRDPVGDTDVKATVKGIRQEL